MSWGVGRGCWRKREGLEMLLVLHAACDSCEFYEFMQCFLPSDVHLLAAEPLQKM